MKSINNYICEKLQISSKGKHYNYFPETKEELKEIIEQRIKAEGFKCNLNDINVSEITDMSQLFKWSDFNGDISDWDVSKVVNMEYMFFMSKFNHDISGWNINDKCNLHKIFYGSPLIGKEKEWWNK